MRPEPVRYLSVGHLEWIFGLDAWSPASCGPGGLHQPEGLHRGWKGKSSSSSSRELLLSHGAQLHL